MTHQNYGITMIAIALTQVIGLLLERFVPPQKYKLPPRLTRRLWCYCILTFSSPALLIFTPNLAESQQSFFVVLGSGLWMFGMIEFARETFGCFIGMARKALREKQPPLG
jgi:hypothetical protein